MRIQYLLGSSSHKLTLEQAGTALTGTHFGETLSGAVRGSVHGDDARFRSSHRIQGTSIGYDFRGKVSGDTMSGTVAMGEYGEAKWTATRKA